MQGVYIANQMVPRQDATDYYDISGMGVALHVCGCTAEAVQFNDLSTRSTDTTGKPLVETRITYNGGGKWQRIKAPKTFAHSKCNRCVTVHLALKCGKSLKALGGSI